MSIFVIGICVVVCLAVVVCVAVASRASRSGHSLAAFLLSITGFLLLAVGFGLVFSGARVVTVREEMIAPAEHAGYRIDLSPRSVDAGPAARLDSGTHLSDSESVGEHADVRSEPKSASERPEPSSSARSPATTDTTAASGDPIDLKHGVEIDWDARPSWVEQDDVDVGEIHEIAICSGPYLRAREARRELNHQLKIEADRYIDELIGHPGAAKWLGYDASELRARLVDPSNVYHEQVVSSVAGIVHQSHALMEFDAKFRDEVTARWRTALATGRLAKVALCAGLVLAVLGVLFGYFQVDTATRGFYSGRLRIGAVVAILAVVAGGVVLARWIPGIWL